MLQMQQIFVGLASAVVCFEHVITGQLGKKAVQQGFQYTAFLGFFVKHPKYSVTPGYLGKGCYSQLACCARCTSVWYQMRNDG